MSKHQIAVFLGPSCTLDEARSHLAMADYFPPAARGSFYNIINDGYRIIVLVDGLFYGTFSVWHKEIMYALDCGIEVIGASSMGALRAVELQGTGMTGVGTVFGWYRDGLIDGDDEVALMHQNEDGQFLGLTVPLVNLRWNLSRAVAAGVIDEYHQALIIEQAKRMCFSDRSLENILAPLAAAMEIAPIQTWLERFAEDIKKIDCIEALQSARERVAGLGALPAPRLRAYEYLHSHVGIEYFTQERLASIRAKGPLGQTPLAQYCASIPAEDPGYRDLLRARVFQRLIVGWAHELHLQTQADEGSAKAAQWDSHALNPDHRLASGLTRIDIARERRDAAFCDSLKQLCCDAKSQGTIAIIDHMLAQDTPLSPIAWQQMIALDGRLVFTLWCLGLKKNIYPEWVGKDHLPQGREPHNAQLAAQTVMAYANWVFETGSGVFGYAFVPAREILLAYQYLNALASIELKAAP